MRTPSFPICNPKANPHPHPHPTPHPHQVRTGEHDPPGVSQPQRKR